MTGGPEFRRDAISGRLVAISPQRSHRPESGFSDASPDDCPFCDGNESQTPPECYAVRGSGSADGPGWRIRAFPNKYPIVSVDAVAPDEVDASPGLGIHEVVVESPRHGWTLTACEPEQWRLAFAAYRDRLRFMSTQPGLASAMVFHNGGRAAGASQEHVHSQIIATPFVPPILEDELRQAARSAAQGRDLFQEFIDRELKIGERIVATGDDFVVLCPWASRFADEVWVVPRAPLTRYELACDHLIACLAAVMRKVLTAVERSGPRAAYNYWLHTAPFGGPDPVGFRWHWEVAPRTTGIAGWELGGGTFVNPSSPESSAANLRRLWKSI